MFFQVEAVFETIEWGKGSRLEVFREINFLKTFGKFPGKHPRQSVILVKLKPIS